MSLRRFFAEFDWLEVGELDVDEGDVDSLSTEEQSLKQNGLTDLTSDGVWCWFQDPRAISNGSKTFTGWVNQNGDIVVASIDETTESIVTNTLHTGLDADDHAAPSILIRDSDGKVIVFYCGHHADPMYYRISSNAGDISAFGIEQSISPSTSHTYPNPRQQSGESGRIYLFYRNGSMNLAYVYSDDGGSSWSTETELVTYTNRVYFKIHGNGTDRIDIALTKDDGGETAPHTDIRHCYFSGGTVYDSAGNSLGTSTAIGNTTLVYDSSAAGNHDAWVWSTAHNGGQPEIGFAEFEALDRHKYRYAKYENGSWNHYKVTDGGSFIGSGRYNEEYYSPGLDLDKTQDGVLYAATGGHQSGKVQRFETEDGGQTWYSSDVSGSTLQNIRPVAPENASSSVPALWLRGEYNYFMQGGYDTSIVYGEEADTGSGEPYRMAGGRVYRDTAQTITSGTFTKVDWTQTSFDARNEMDLSADTFTAGRSGWYMVSAKAGLSNISAAGEFIVTLYKNGAEYEVFDRKTADAGTFPTGGGTVPVWLDKGDTVSVYVYHDTGADQSTRSAEKAMNLSVFQYA